MKDRINREESLPRSGSGAPTDRWARSIVIHGAAAKTSSIFSDMAPIVEWVSSAPLVQKKSEASVSPAVSPAEQAAEVVPAAPVAVMEDTTSELVDVEMPVLAGGAVVAEDFGAETHQSVVPSESVITVESASPPPPSPVLTAHLLSCEYCGESISKLRTDSLQIGSSTSQWATCPGCSSARRMSAVQFHAADDGVSWFVPLKYLFTEWRERSQNRRRAFFVDCSPTGALVGVGKRGFKNSAVLAELFGRTGPAYDAVEVPFLLETGIGLREHLRRITSCLAERGVVHLTTLRKPHFSRPNSTSGWTCARLENLIHFPSIRGLGNLLERTDMKVVKTRSVIVVPITAQEANRLSSASGLNRLWLLGGACWAAMQHTMRCGFACQLTLRPTKRAAGSSEQTSSKRKTKSGGRSK